MPEKNKLIATSEVWAPMFYKMKYMVVEEEVQLLWKSITSEIINDYSKTKFKLE